MNLHERIYTFLELGKDLRTLSEEERQLLTLQAKANNYWFTSENVQLSLQTISHYLQQDSLTQWLSQYNISGTKPKRVGVVMAGNIPAEGFHDSMCVLLSGHTLVAKVSPQDDVLMKKIAQLLVNINADFEERIIFAERLHGIDAIIASVAANTVGQFNRYFNHIPNIIRSQKRSCAVIRGDETTTELLNLGNDILNYFGLGSRNVSKLYVPEGYSFNQFFGSIEPWSKITEHHKYVNNYDYNKSILLVNQLAHQDNGFLLLHENGRLQSPIAVVHFEYYKDANELNHKIAAHKPELQHIVSRHGWYPESISFGQAAKPTLGDYIGGVDTMHFLSSL